MGRLLNLLDKYPRAKRDVVGRALAKTPEDVQIARKFGREFFDGERRHGYGGYTYSSTRWKGVVEDIVRHYAPFYSVLDVGCAKGYMLREMLEQVSGLAVAGIDVSEYAIAQADPMVKDFCQVASAKSLPFEDKAFDLVISINTVHNLNRDGCIESLQEIERVGSEAYVTVDAYRTLEERELILGWNLTAQTILHVDEWIKLFKEAGYRGDYGWWLP